MESLRAIIKLAENGEAFYYHHLLAMLNNVNIPLHSTLVHYAICMVLTLNQLQGYVLFILEIVLSVSLVHTLIAL